MNPTTARVLSWLAALMMPVFLVITAVRIVFTPLSVPVVYQVPGFPPDRYGFTMQEREHWARISLEYLLNDSDISFLANQRLADGQPLYNERELSHMVDVKNLFQKAFTVWTVLLVILAGLALWAWRGHWMHTFLRGLANGGKLTFALVIFILVLVAISFNSLFTTFHEIFFTGDSWLFSYSDTLIRLFPLPLWELSFIVAGILTFIGAAIFIILDWRYNR